LLQKPKNTEIKRSTFRFEFGEELIFAMKVIETHSHFNGLEHLLVHKRGLWQEIQSAIEQAELLEGCADKLKLKGWPINVLGDSGFLKERIGLNVVSSKSALINDLPAHYLWSYVRDEIDVGIEILPMKSLQQHMSSGPAYYEGELYNVIRNGRGVPAVPLVMIGIAP